MTPMNIAETLSFGTRTLSPHSDSPRLDAEILLGKVLGLSRAALIAHDNDVLADANERAYADLIAKRSAGMPVAYLTGIREFWSLSLNVSPGVLVPRPETEILVEQALRLKSPNDSCSVLDLGTGSGAIALAIAAERPRWSVTGIDVSPAALRVARQNAQALDICGIEWALGSWFEPVQGQHFDLIVSNPPYVAGGDPALAALAAEPALALTPGPTGLEALAAIISQAAAHLNAHGWLLLEHGSDQAKAVVSLLEQQGMGDIRTMPDFAGRSRVTLASARSHKPITHYKRNSHDPI
jgi:release factor glutamine methyltransferase